MVGQTVRAQRKGEVRSTVSGLNRLCKKMENYFTVIKVYSTKTFRSTGTFENIQEGETSFVQDPIGGDLD